MKPNRFQQVLRQGRIPVGHMVWEFASRGLPRILESADLDFVVYDMEHSGFDVDRIADLLAWSHGCSFAPFVRVPEDKYHFLARVMDSGALGVMLPNVKTAAQAARIVDAVKYPPNGHRGLGLGHAHNNYIAPNPTEYLAYSDSNTTVICQIESPEGLANVDAIAATPGVDVIWIGHYDLTANMGILAQFDNPDFQAALRTVVQAANKHGKAAAIQPGTPLQLADWRAAGFHVLSYGADSGLYKTALSEAVLRVRA
ncbi:HpcH/HpaI aldolase family protein [Bryobacter aggregatus]|uniref:HpcH/HpaI aldolase family protein n=1 Tax=Bryobacter aggregatus TaxID=360054 RepID=UPI0004E26937|nr:aldolase/citrate lyase family protein [Bryobacter aggregatus]